MLNDFVLFIELSNVLFINTLYLLGTILILSNTGERKVSRTNLWKIVIISLGFIFIQVSSMSLTITINRYILLNAYEVSATYFVINSIYFFAAIFQNIIWVIYILIIVRFMRVKKI